MRIRPESVGPQPVRNRPASGSENPSVVRETAGGAAGACPAELQPLQFGEEELLALPHPYHVNDYKQSYGRVLTKPLAAVLAAAGEPQPQDPMTLDEPHAGTDAAAQPLPHGTCLSALDIAEKNRGSWFENEYYS
eukprot:SAG22_NODE_2284_length_2758_cov_2.590071_4_plen_135_part_00